jgi:hypothetical protein
VIGKSFRIRAAVLLVALLLSALPVGCSSRPGATPSPDPSTTLQAIPAADPAQYERMHDMKSWRNPYLIVRTDGVALLDAADHALIRLKPEELLPALAALPASDWPYGRVVAAAENRTSTSEQDGVAIRRNKGIVGGILEGAHIAIKWVPAG